MTQFLVLTFAGPLQAWGDIAMDPRRPTRAFPSRSALAGLIANALGWRHRDADRITVLQDSLVYAIREDRPPIRVRDYQTADLERETAGWTRWGVESRGPSSGTQLLDKHYLADALFSLAITIRQTTGSATYTARTTLDEIEAALRKPARPLFLGRKSCPPSLPLVGPTGECHSKAATPAEALLKLPLATTAARGAVSDAQHIRIWFDPADGSAPDTLPVVDDEEVWDRRDFRTNRFGGSRRIALLLVERTNFPIIEEA